MTTPLSNPEIDTASPKSSEIWQGVATRLILPLVAIILIFWNLLYLVNNWALMPANDFGRMLHSARAFVDGRDMYAWSRATPAKLEKDYAIDLYNMNPPHFHLLLVPLTLLEDDHALAVWWVLSGLCLFHCLRWIVAELELELTPAQRRQGLLLILAFSGTAAMLGTAQLCFVLLVPITLMWLAARRGLWGWSGACLGLSLSVKPFLGIILVFYAWRRQWRALAGCLVSMLVCFALGLAVFGWDNHLSWRHRLEVSESWAWLPMNASLTGMLTRTFTESVWYVPLLSLPAGAVWGLWLGIGGAIGLATLAVTSRGSAPADVDRNYFLLLAASVLLCPLGWIYYLWLLLPSLVAVCAAGWPWLATGPPGADALRRRWTKRLLAVVMLAFTWPIIGTRLFQPNAWFLRFPDPATQGQFRPEAIATLFIGNIYFWGMLAVWLCLVWEAFARRNDPTRKTVPQLAPLDPADYRVSVVMPVFSETDTVRQITRWLLGELGQQLEEIVIVQSPRSSAVSRTICQQLAAAHPQVRLQTQENNPGLGHAVREAYANIRGNLVLNIDSDGEMEIETVSRLLAEMARGDFAMVVASRWSPGGGFSGYSRPKYYLNWCFQQLFRWLFWTRVHDLTYGFKVLRAELVKGIRWQGTLHEIACETTLKPIRLGVPVSEVPSKWTTRAQGASKNTFWRNFRYVRTAFGILFRGVAFTASSDRADEEPMCACIAQENSCGNGSHNRAVLQTAAQLGSCDFETSPK